MKLGRSTSVFLDLFKNFGQGTVLWTLHNAKNSSHWCSWGQPAAAKQPKSIWAVNHPQANPGSRWAPNKMFPNPTQKWSYRLRCIHHLENHPCIEDFPCPAYCHIWLAKGKATANWYVSWSCRPWGEHSLSQTFPAAPHHHAIPPLHQEPSPPSWNLKMAKVETACLLRMGGGRSAVSKASQRHQPDTILGMYWPMEYHDEENGNILKKMFMMISVIFCMFHF